MKLPSRPSSPSLKLSRPNVKLSVPKLGLPFGGRGAAEIVGLDIQPGFVAAVQARVNGSILAERAAIRPLAADTMRDGEVLDEETLAEVLKELFAESGLGRHVRIGVANQRTVLRTLELPPVTDQKELAAAVTFQAQDQVPMPLNNAVLDFHPLGVVDTPSGPRQRVVLVAAQRDMVERLLNAARRAGLTPEGVDLSAFALIRSLYRYEGAEAPRVLYLNVDGLTNLAIAEGKICRFTRVVGGGLEGMAVEVAERRGIALAEARELVAHVDLTAEPPARQQVSVPEPGTVDLSSEAQAQVDDGEEQSPESAEASESAEPPAAEPALEEQPAAAPNTASADADVWSVVENGIRELSGEVRNSLDFHRSQDGGGEVAHVVLSGAAEEIPGFAEALELALGVPVHRQAVGVADGRLNEQVSTHRLAIATGLAATEAAL
jgi:type IV pilus assembly protein PilM